MATEPLLPFDELLEAIPGDEPAGESVPFTVRQELEELRKEVNPSDYPEDDPMRPAEAKRADWKAIIRTTQDTLKDTSKDLLIAARLTEALTKENGFGGLRDGLHLMKGMIEQCWDRMYPDIDDGDLEVRAAPFNWLDDPDRGARFPTTVRMVPLVYHDGAGLAWRHWKSIQEGDGQFSAADFENAVAAVPREHCQNIVDDLEGAVHELSELIQVLNGKLADEAPSLMQVYTALSECSRLANHILDRKGPPPGEGFEDEESDSEIGEAATGGGADGEAPARKKGHTREDIYRRLKEAAGQLAAMEPHSPIPYLIHKAVDLGSMPFPQLMRALIRDDGVISEMNRELGIKDAEAPDEYTGEE